MERKTDYELPNRFIANHKELMQVLHDKGAVRIFGNGERMATQTALEFNKAFLERLQANTPEEQRERIHRMPTLAKHYGEIVEWAQAVTASPQALYESTGIDNARHLAAEPAPVSVNEDEAADPLGEPDPRPRRPSTLNELG